MKQSKRSKRRNRHNYITDNQIMNWWKQGLLVLDDPVVFRTEEEEKEYRDKLYDFNKYYESQSCWINELDEWLEGYKVKHKQ